MKLIWGTTYSIQYKFISFNSFTFNFKVKVFFQSSKNMFDYVELIINLDVGGFP